MLEVGSGREGFKYHGSGRVGVRSGGFQVSRVHWDKPNLTRPVESPEKEHLRSDCCPMVSRAHEYYLFRVNGETLCLRCVCHQHSRAISQSPPASAYKIDMLDMAASYPP